MPAIQEDPDASSQTKDEELLPPAYDTILDIPDWKAIPPPPSYEEPILHGIGMEKGDYLHETDTPPPPYSPHEQQALPRLAYADFLPRCHFPGDGLQPAQCDDLKTLMTVVNQWLQNNNQYTVIRCESIERKLGNNGCVESETTIRHQGIFVQSYYIRGIRLWLTPSIPGSTPQQIWYMNVVPKATPVKIPVGFGMGMGVTVYEPRLMLSGSMMYGARGRSHMAMMGVSGLMAWPVFENMDTVLEKLNTKLKSEPIPGHILTIESIDTKYAEGFDFKKMDPDCTSWSERGVTNKLFLSILRIFFTMGKSEEREIGIQDFAPVCLTPDHSPLGMPQFESYSNAVQRASSWIAQQQDKRITNVQTVAAKITNNVFMGQRTYDLKKMDYMQGSWDSTFIKVMRVAYVKEPARNPDLTTRAFVPVRYGSRKAETTSQTVMRANDWLSCTGARVFGVDTLEYEFQPDSVRPVNTDSARISIYHRRGHYWISTIRLYLDGIYSEPLPEVFPPIPAFIKADDSSSCCTII